MPKTHTRIYPVLTGAFMAAAVLLTAACGGPIDPEKPGSANDSDSYTVNHAMGTETFDVAPKRVVVIDSPQLDALLALDVVPVGATESGAAGGFPGYVANLLQDTKSVGATAEPDIDAIANLDPDLIIGSKIRHEAIYDELQAIAPTVFSVNSGTDWNEQALITAAALNQTETMEKKIFDLDARAASIGEAVDTKGTTVSMVRFRPDNFRLYGPETFSGSILAQAGFVLGSRDWNEFSMMELSPELYEQIDGEIIFYTNPGGDPAATTLGTINKLWGDLSGVKNKRVYEVDDETWMVGIGVMGANVILDDIEKLLK